ncbi:hypothetical protein PGIGA_G00019060 [Pangasianodon gigas]|uniref:Uncharacterized protein n=1 Tax=Pangasianodon gigas TaxID=30993 RepID=A0ACC5WV96_PANGG|nr:hypothetical protein [Pangasianodon gigas]
MAKQYDVLFRLVLLGDSGVGKTCLLCRLTDNEFLSPHISTIGVDFKMKTIEVNGIKVRIQIWDTAGQERYQTITKQYYRRAQGIFLVYDITSSLSFQHIMKWISDVDEYAPHIVQKILVGNKHDEEHRRQVTTEQGNKLAKSYGMDFLETSAFTNYNINEAFIRMTELVLEANKEELDSALPSNNDDLGATETEQEHEYSTCSWTTTRDYSQLNQLQSRYPHRLVVLAFPCNQFGYQENCRNGEILNSLKHVRPGGGFEPSFTVFEKCDVNGANTHPVFAYLKDKLPYPDDDPVSLIQDPKFLVWSPISRTDISWNFEKFLIGPEGEPFKRYSKNFETINIEPDIQRLLRLTKN